MGSGNILRAVIFGCPIAVMLHTYDVIHIPQSVMWILFAVWVGTMVVGLRLSAATVKRKEVESDAFKECEP